MFKATIKDTNYVDGQIHAQVEFSDGTTTLVENIKAVKKLDFDNWIKSRTGDLNDAKAFAESLTAGEYAVEEPTIEPTEEELAKTEWFKKKAALNQMIEDMKQGKELGIEPDEEQTQIMQGLADWVNTNMKQEYYF